MAVATVQSLPATLNFSIYVGTTFNLVLTWTSNGTPINLTSYTANMNIVNAETGVLIVNLNTTDGSIVLGGTAGTIMLELTATQTGTLTPPPTIGAYDLLLTDGSGNVTALTTGSVDIIQGYTAT